MSETEYVACLDGPSGEAARRGVVTPLELLQVFEAEAAEGLTFTSPSDERVLIRGNPREIEFRFQEVDHPLVGASKGVKYTKPSPAILPNNVNSYGADWSLLAYTVVSNKDYQDLYREPTGPSYVVRADPRTCPLALG